jgi:hypothetical protein
MRVHELYGDLFEAVTAEDVSSAGVSRGSMALPDTFRHTMPSVKSFEDMDMYYEFYRFVIALAGTPDEDAPPIAHMRDVPIAVAYTQAEHDMIMTAAKRMGFKPTELAYKGSKELPDTYTKSPVMKFHMPESQQRRLRDIVLLSEAMTYATK